MSHPYSDVVVLTVLLMILIELHAGHHLLPGGQGNAVQRHPLLIIVSSIECIC